MNVIIEPADKNDIEKLNIISHSAKMYWNYSKEWMELWKDELKISLVTLNEQFVYKLQLDEAIIGFCAIKESKKNYEITHLWILPEYIGKGFGKKLLNETLNYVVKTDKEIIVISDPNSESFYASQGFSTFDQYQSQPADRYLPVMKK